MPHEDVVLQSGTDATAKEAVALCIRLVPGWAALRPEEVTVSVISGGITNSLLKVRGTGSKAFARLPCVPLTCLLSLLSSAQQPAGAPRRERPRGASHLWPEHRSDY